MTPRSFFIILVKLMGLYLLLLSLPMVLSWIATLVSMPDWTGTYSVDLGSLLLVALMMCGAFALVLKYFIFSPGWIVDKLALDKGFAEEKFEINPHRSVVLSIAIIVIGGLIFIDGLPSLCENVFNYMKFKGTGQIELMRPGQILSSFIKTITGFLLVSNNRRIVSFIESKRSSRLPSSPGD